ncbi:MAG: hypothetical protein Tsb0015_09460 [Simkaniaceae bacterium]
MIPINGLGNSEQPDNTSRKRSGSIVDEGFRDSLSKLLSQQDPRSPQTRPRNYTFSGTSDISSQVSTEKTTDKESRMPKFGTWKKNFFKKFAKSEEDGKKSMHQDVVITPKEELFSSVDKDMGITEKACLESPKKARSKNLFKVMIGQHLEKKEQEKPANEKNEIQRKSDKEETEDMILTEEDDLEKAKVEKPIETPLENPLLGGNWSQSYDNLKKILKPGLVLVFRLKDSEEKDSLEWSDLPEEYGKVPPLPIRKKKTEQEYIQIDQQKGAEVITVSKSDMDNNYIQVRVATKEEIMGKRISVEFANEFSHTKDRRIYLEDLRKEKSGLC